MADDELSRPVELPDLKVLAMWHDVGHLTTSFQQVAQPIVVIDTAEPSRTDPGSGATPETR